MATIKSGGFTVSSFTPCFERAVDFPREAGFEDGVSKLSVSPVPGRWKIGSLSKEIE